jgi:CheY-like chemotaxis protein
MAPTEIRLLVIDDQPHNADFWRQQAEQNSCTVRTVVADNSAELFQLLAPLLEKEAFHGSVLDIGFQKEQLGGIALWRRLKRTGLLDQTGLLLVATRVWMAGEVGVTIETFAQLCANGRLILGLAPEGRAARFLDFLNDIRARLIHTTDPDELQEFLPLQLAFPPELWRGVPEPVRPALEAMLAFINRRSRALEDELAQLRRACRK